jgi:hypothetical protein
MYTGIKQGTLQSEVLNVNNLYSQAFSTSNPDELAKARVSLIAEIWAGLTADRATINRLRTLTLNELQYENTAKLKLPHAHLLVKIIESSAKLQASFGSLLETIYPQQVLNNLIQINTIDASKEPLITQKEAIEIASEMAQKALTSPNFMAQLASEYGINDPEKVPEVRASGSLDTTNNPDIPRKKSLIQPANEAIIYSILDDFEASEVGD